MEDDESYFRRRAEQALDLAQRSDDPCVVSAHYRLAEAYLERIAQAAPNETDDAGHGEKPLFAFGPAKPDSF